MCELVAVVGAESLERVHALCESGIVDHEAAGAAPNDPAQRLGREPQSVPEEDVRLGCGGRLDEDAASPDPLVLFQQWLDQALTSEIPEATAMTLATVASDMRPSTRVVLLKGCSEAGLVWYTNRHSRKGQELAANPYAV